jgi:type III secretory pathway component EscV
MMIVPLPTWLLDILIATNLSASVAILLVVLYVPDALAIATFPTILLPTKSAGLPKGDHNEGQDED